jgi:hypothetical protein
MSTPEPGLCATCIYKKLVISDRGSEFFRCTYPGLPKYPRLPVVNCSAARTSLQFLDPERAKTP